MASLTLGIFERGREAPVQLLEIAFRTPARKERCAGEGELVFGLAKRGETLSTGGRSVNGCFLPMKGPGGDHLEPAGRVQFSFCVFCLAVPRIPRCDIHCETQPNQPGAPGKSALPLTRCHNPAAVEEADDHQVEQMEQKTAGSLDFICTSTQEVAARSLISWS
jgi:hypothetical protein